MTKAKTDRSKLEFLRQSLAARQAKPGPHELMLLLDGLNPDFNIGKIFRSAETFGCAGIYLAGVEWFDPGSAVGAFKKVPSKFFKTAAEAVKDLQAQGYTLYALAPGEGDVLGQVDLEQRCAFVLGNEATGLSFDPLALGVKSLRIPQYGLSQSLNVSVAAAVASWEWLRRWAKRDAETMPQPGDLRGARQEHLTPKQEEA